jgi:glycosyltransferase involved in cell wall biosynthesis
MMVVDRGRLLFLAPVVPSRSGNGLAMRAGFFLDAYARVFDVDLAIIPIAAGSNEITEFVRGRVRRAEIVPLSGPDSHYELVAAVADPSSRLAAFRKYGRPSLTSRLTVAVRAALDAWTGAGTFDVVHVSRLYLAELASPWMDGANRVPRMVIDCDEDDASAYGRLARMEWRQGNDLAARWAQAEAAGFDRMARQWLPRFDLKFVAARGEGETLARRAGGRIAVVPNVAPAARARKRSRPNAGLRTLIFVGTIGYAPNADAIMWFTSHIWPRLRRALPFPIRLMIVGQSPPARITRLARCANIVVTGRVSDLAPFYDAADLAIAPIRSGGGTRIKLLEAAMFGVPMVSTTFAAQGIAFRRGTEILLADSETKFVADCAALLMNPRLAARIAARARWRARQAYDAEFWARRVVQQMLHPTVA